VRHSSLLLILLTLTFSACKQKTQEQSTPEIQIKQESQVLLLTSGYDSKYENFSSNELIAKLQQDSSNTYILKSIWKELSNVIPLVKAKSVETVGDVPLSDSVLFLTDLQHLAPSLKVLKIDDKDFFDEPASYPLISNKSKAIEARRKMTLINLTGTTAITRGVCFTIESNGID